MRAKKSNGPTASEITVRQAIELSGMTRQGIYSILVNGRVAYKKWGNVYAIDHDSFLRYLRSPRRRQMRQQLPVE
jgi:hypothetical protein